MKMVTVTLASNGSITVGSEFIKTGIIVCKANLKYDNNSHVIYIFSELNINDDVFDINELIDGFLNGEHSMLAYASITVNYDYDKVRRNMVELSDDIRFGVDIGRKSIISNLTFTKYVIG